MKKTIIKLVEVFLIFIASIICIFGIRNIFINSKNELVDLIENVAINQSKVQLALQNRSDYIPRLIEEAQKSIGSEVELLGEIDNLSVQIANCIDSGRYMEAEKYNSKLTLKLEDLYWMHPVLRKNERFGELKKRVEECEKNINFVIGEYNKSAKAFNTKLQEFPIGIVAKILGYNQMRYFEADVS